MTTEEDVRMDRYETFEEFTDAVRAWLDDHGDALDANDPHEWDRIDVRAAWRIYDGIPDATTDARLGLPERHEGTLDDLLNDDALAGTVWISSDRPMLDGRAPTTDDRMIVSDDDWEHP